MTGEYVGTTLFILCCLGGVQLVIYVLSFTCSVLRWQLIYRVAKLPETSVTGNLDEPLNTSSL